MSDEVYGMYIALLGIALVLIVGLVAALVEARPCAGKHQLSMKDTICMEIERTDTRVTQSCAQAEIVLLWLREREAR